MLILIFIVFIFIVDSSWCTSRLKKSIFNVTIIIIYHYVVSLNVYSTFFSASYMWVAQIQRQETRGKIWRYTRIGKGGKHDMRWGERKWQSNSEKIPCLCFLHLTRIFLFLLLSHQCLPLTALSDPSPLIWGYLLSYVLETWKTVCQWFIQPCLCTQMLSIPSYLFSHSLSSPPTDLHASLLPDVISTAFTELINGLEGWVLFSWDNSFSLSLAHTDNYIQKMRKQCKKR